MDPKPAESAGLEPLPGPRHEKNNARIADSKASRTTSNLLADISFERKNKPQPRLPPGYTIQKRPILHPPIAAPCAGPDVQKVVYVSKSTPIMAAVKRVKKLLEQVEKRNLQREGVLGNGRRTGNSASATQKKNGMKREVVLVKGSGRAIEQAAKVGEWFKRHAEDGDGGWVVDIRALSVKVIDNIVEDTSTKVDNIKGRHDHNEGSTSQVGKRLDCLDGENIDMHDVSGQSRSGNEDSPDNHVPPATEPTTETAAKQKQGRKKRKRPLYDEHDVPEARTRFINAVEIAISLG